MHSTALQIGKQQLNLAPHFNDEDIKGQLYSNMAVLPNNKRVILIYDTPSGASSGYYFTSSYDGVNWESPIPFNAPTVDQMHLVKIVGDKQGRLHVLLQSNATPKSLYYVQLDSALNTLISAVEIDANPNFGSYNGAYLSLDKQDRIHVMWHEGDTNIPGDIPECFYSQSTDGGLSFSPKIPLSDTTDHLPSAFPRGQFSACYGDTLIIAWRNLVTSAPEDWDIHYATSTDGGLSWSSPVVLDSHQGIQQDPDVVVAPNGDFHIFTHEAPLGNPFFGMRVVYRKSTDLGLTWTDEVNVSSSTRCQLPEGSRYVETTKTLWTFFKEEGVGPNWSGDIMATYSTDEGLSWSTPEYMTDEDTVIVRFKAIAFLYDGTPVCNVEVPTHNSYPDFGKITVKYVERISAPLTETHSEVLNTAVSVFPNPTRGILHLNFASNLDVERIKIGLYAATGQQLLSGVAMDCLDLSHFPKGVYCLNITCQAGVETFKIVKQ